MKRRWREFEPARAWARSLGLRNQQAWRGLVKAGNKPDDIPTDPRNAYKNEGWKGMADWLGTGTRRVGKEGWRAFPAAREWARSLDLHRKAQWKELLKAGELPEDIPGAPDVYYRDKGWVTWQDWLGADYVHPRNRKYLDFEEARAWARAQGIAGKPGWNALCKEGRRPASIPVTPDRVYKDQWQGWSDWTGRDYVHPRNRHYRSYEEARAWVRAQGVHTLDEWQALAAASGLPADIPANPDHVYKDTGWLDWSHWLGTVNMWRRGAILAFLRDLAPHVATLSPMALLAILRQNGMARFARYSPSANAPLLAEVVTMARGGQMDALAQLINQKLAAAGVSSDPGVLITDEPEPKMEPGPLIDMPVDRPVVPPPNGKADHNAVRAREALPILEPEKLLAAVDYATLTMGSDEEACEFFIAEAVGTLWRHYLQDEALVDINRLMGAPAGVYGNTVRDRFMRQLKGARGLQIPAGYAFHKNAALLPPNLMQRLVAYRLLQEHSVGNWSGTGAGKTLAAILASRVVDSRLTVIVALNNTLEQWAAVISNAFPDSVVVVKPKDELVIALQRHTYVLLNFEAFGDKRKAPVLLRRLLARQVAMIVLDEVHNAKYREGEASTRRKNLQALLCAARAQNPDLYVLGMSATPVINMLGEGKSLLEMLLDHELEELGTAATLNNVVALHQKLVLHGVRMKPRYSQTFPKETLIPIPGDDLLSDLLRVPPRDLLGLEQVLLRAKLPVIAEQAQPGTLIYTEYVEGMVAPIKTALEARGLSVAVFTGDDKSGLRRFTVGKADVLIGSGTLREGVDGLQARCGRIVVASLPWTGAGFEQLVGRVWRQGMVHDHVDLLLPQVVLSTDSEDWSWDQRRHDRVRYKRTLADAAVDGVIPEGVLEQPLALLGRSMEALKGWVARIEAEGPAPMVERALLRVPLPPLTMEQARYRWGTMSQMNARYASAHSATTHQRLQGNPTEWYYYHSLYREARQGWAEVPVDRMEAWLRARPHLVVGDFGCGEAQLAGNLPNVVHSFDHVAIDERVTACDMAHVPLADESLDVAIFSLSLWGLNWEDYLVEAARVLRLDGRLRIAAASGNWPEPKRALLLAALHGLGFRLIGEIEERAPFFYLDAIKTGLALVL